MGTPRMAVVLLSLWAAGCGGSSGDGAGGGDDGTAVPSTVVTGRVVDSQGEPVPDALVVITSDPVTTRTDASGTFSTELLPGEHRVTVTVQGVVIGDVQFQVLDEAALDLGTVPLGRLFYLGGVDWFQDSDEDGYPAGVPVNEPFQPDGRVLASSLLTATDLDCDDTQPLVNPGAAEVCGDGVDDDCDGADAPCPLTWYRDGDGDGYTTGATLSSVDPPPGYVLPAALINTTELDCDDAQPQVNPGAADVCADGIDADCSGSDSPCDPVTLDADTRAGFTVPTPFDGPRLANVAVNAAGAAVAVWSADTGTGYKVLAAVRPAAAGSWQPEDVLAAGTYDLWQPVKAVGVASDGEGFLVAWVVSRELYADRLVPDGAGTWGWEGVSALAEFSTFPTFSLATNGSGYAVAASGGSGLWVWVHDGAGWGGGDEVGFLGGAAVPVFALASNGDGYAVVFPDPGLRAYFWTGAGWSPPVQMGPADPYAESVDIASDGSGYGVVWAGSPDTPGGAVLLEDPLGTWTVAADAEFDVSPGTGRVTKARIASNGFGYLAVLEDDDIGGIALWELRHTGGAWTAPSPIPVLSPITPDSTNLVSDGMGYGLAWRDPGAAFLLRDDLGWHGGGTTPAGWATPQVIGVAPGPGGYLAVWNTSEMAVLTAPFGDAGWSEPQDLVQGAHRGGVRYPRLTRAADGTVLATWVQHDQAGAVLYGRLRVGGAWNDPQEIVRYLGQRTAIAEYDVASRGPEFLVTCERSGRPCAVACTETAPGVWEWGAIVELANTSSNGPRVVSRGEDYLVSWGAWSLFGNRFDGAAWAGQEILYSAPSGFVVGLDAASDQSGYAVLLDHGSGTARQILADVWDGVGWSGATVLDGCYGTVDVESDGDGYAALWLCGGNVRYSLFDGSSWTPSATLAQGEDGLALAADPTGYTALWIERQTLSSFDVFAASHDGVTWGAVELLDTSDGSSRSPSPRAAACDDGFSATWTRAAGAVHQLMASTRSAGVWESPHRLSDAARDVGDHAVAGGTLPCGAAWTEQDPQDPAVYRLIVDLDL